MKKITALLLILFCFTSMLYSSAADKYVESASEKIQSNDYSGAIKDLNKSIKLNPKLSNAYFVRGTAKIGLGDYQSAIKDFNQAIELDPKFVNFYVARGLAKVTLNDFEGAIKDLNKSIELDPCKFRRMTTTFSAA